MSTDTRALIGAGIAVLVTLAFALVLAAVTVGI